MKLVPQCLKDLPQWVLWKSLERGDKPTKVPHQVNGNFASSTDPATWSTYQEASAALTDEYDGLGFVFSKDDPFVGIDLDGCRGPEGGSEWARRILHAFDTYSELSPSGTGVKLFLRGKLPFDRGRKVDLDAEAVAGKAPGIEVYEHGRFFAVTGQRVTGVDVEERGKLLGKLCQKYFPDPAPTNGATRRGSPVIDRARQYVSRMPHAVSGQSGHNATFRVACVLRLGFQLTRDESLQVLKEYNQRCEPPWTLRELEHKVDSADQQPGPRGYLRNQPMQHWHAVPVPDYKLPTSKDVACSTVIDLARDYLVRLESGEDMIVPTDMPGLDHALGGGVAEGEMIVIAARPSQGKSMVAMQMLHHWSASGSPCLFISEEMSAQEIGSRVLSYVSHVPKDDWRERADDVTGSLEGYEEKHASVHVAFNCGDVSTIAAQVEKFVAEKDVTRVVVDYAQRITSGNRTRYEDISKVSIELSTIAKKHNLVMLVLCQLGRGIEERKVYVPRMSDIKESGQFEQDADVIIALCWPHMLDKDKPRDEYQFFVLKNRNRGIVDRFVECKIEPHRQRLVDKTGCFSGHAEKFGEFVSFEDAIPWEA